MHHYCGTDSKRRSFCSQRIAQAPTFPLASTGLLQVVAPVIYPSGNRSSSGLASGNLASQERWPVQRYSHNQMLEEKSWRLEDSWLSTVLWPHNDNTAPGSNATCRRREAP
eukprot:INCI18863.2.p1 GENE.INCI18863.2~~INCI18863.2.p1  ORF type:complete len:125 (+),score=6.72 INCI18863.2:44-376(+)